MAVLLSQISTELALLAITTLAGVAIHRLWLSPLAKFPGPKIAALTGAYEGFYNCFKDGGGRYWERVDRMHDQYGPIVRIGPRELHIRDPDWSEVYKVTRRASKDKWYYQTLGAIGSAATTIDAETHRMRRDALQAYFSPSAVARHEPQIEKLIAKLINRLRQFKGLGQPVDLGAAFRCLATDAATAFVFRQPFGHLDSPDFEHVANTGVRKFGRFGQFNRHFHGWLMKLARMMPPWLALKLNPSSLGVMGLFKKLAIVVEAELGSGPHTNGAPKASQEDEAQQNVIQQILNSNLPPEEKAPWRVERESGSVTLAGTETTGSSLATMFYFLLSHPDKLARLQAELGSASKTYGRPPSYEELKELPYLSAVINEGLRLVGSVSGRLPRFDPRQDIKYKEWVIPKGTIISTNLNDTNFSPTLFPEPHKFLPERWLISDDNKTGGSGTERISSRYTFPFGRGPRMCLGMEMAFMELYMVVGRLCGPGSPAGSGEALNLELEEGIDYQEDVALFHDYFAPFPKSWKGIKAFVK